MQSALELKRYRRRLRSKWKQKLRRKGIYREGQDARLARLRFERRQREKAETNRLLELQRKAEARASVKVTPRRGFLARVFHRISMKTTGRR